METERQRDWEGGRTGDRGGEGRDAMGVLPTAM
jgi:hypothetical protein